MGNAGELLNTATRRLRGSGAASPRLDAELLLAAAVCASREVLLAHPERELSAEAQRRFAELLDRRANLEPMAYLLGEREFYGRTFHVDRRALIPRPETELLVELGIAAVDRWRTRGVEPTVVEIGTGAGAVAISLALERNVHLLATDVAEDALTLARENATLLGADALVSWQATDLLHGVDGPLHVVLANLPYVPRDRVLPRDVSDYEPHVALFGGQRGTELIERLLHEARFVLCQGGELSVELDEEEQALPVAALARQLYSGEVEICRDAGGYDRVVRVVA